MRTLVTFLVSFVVAYFLYETITKWIVVFLSSMNSVKAMQQTTSALFNQNIGDLITTMPVITLLGAILTALIFTKSKRTIRYDD